jgi:putative addiction module killer protein
VPEYETWLSQQPEKVQVQIEERLARIRYDAHYGDHRSVSTDNSVWELRWKNGRRVYYAMIPGSTVLVLLGGNKNGQDKDISKAKRLFKKYTA